MRKSVYRANRQLRLWSRRLRRHFRFVDEWSVHTSHTDDGVLHVKAVHDWRGEFEFFFDPLVRGRGMFVTDIDYKPQGHRRVSKHLVAPSFDAALTAAERLCHK